MTTTLRQSYRDDLAALLDRDVDALADTALLVEDLALDSLAMMSLLTWLEGHGVQVDADRDRPASVGDVLSLVDKAGFPQLSIRVTDRPDADLPDLADPAAVTVWPQPSTDPLVPVLSGRTFRLTPVGPDDVGFLYSLAVQPETSFRWRYRGAPPPFDRFAADMWQQVLVQYVARRTADDQPIGHLIGYAASPGTRHVYLGAVFHPRYAGTGLPAQAAALFTRYLFHTFPLRKLYMEVPGFNWPLVRSGQDRLFRVEGVLREHSYYAGRYWDEYLCAIYPERIDGGGP